jgi:hypothetical protein
VNNALNPLLWASVIAPITWVFAYLFRDDVILNYAFVAFRALPPFTVLVAYFVYFFVDRDRLQSEEFVLRQKELAIIERKEHAPIVYDQIVEDDAPPASETHEMLSEKRS